MSTGIVSETWRPVGGYEGLYEISDKPQVRRIVNSRKSKAGSLLKFSMDANGYLRVGLRKDGEERSFYVHRLVARTFIGDPPAGKPHINHLNGIKTDNRVDNLEWCSPGENSIHAVKTGLFVASKGEQHCKARLTESDVLAIRATVGITHRALGERYGVGRQTITGIITRKRWRHI